MADGSITIDILASTDKFDKKIAQLERKMAGEEEKKLEYDVEINIKEEQLNKAKKLLETIPQHIDKIQGRMQNLAVKMDSMEIGSVEYDNASRSMSELQLKAQVYQNILNLLPGEITKQEAHIENIKNDQEIINDKVAEYKQEIEGIKLQKQASEVERIKKGFEKVGSSIQKSVNRVGRLVLGIFGIRAAISTLSRASSDLVNYDKQYAANLEYIRYVLTQAIAPVLRGIVSLVVKLLGYINAIAQGWFGVNLFANGSAESFKKMKAGANGVSKAVKEIKKQLTGFDEINVLTDQSDTGTQGGAGGVGMPDFDLSKMQGEPPEWLKWIVDNKDLILSILAGIVGFIVALKIGLDALTGLGIGIMIGGIVYAIQNLIGYLNDPSWENFGGVIQGVGVAIIGLAILINSVPVAVAGAIILIIGTITKYWEDIKKFFQGGIDWLQGKSEWVHQMFGDTLGNIYDTIVANLQEVLNIFDAYFTSIKGIFDGLITFVKGVFTGNWKQAWEGVQKIFSSVWTGIQKIWTSVFTIIKNSVVTVAKTAGDIISSVFKTTVNAVMQAIEDILNSPIRAINGLISVINAIPGINLGYLSTFNLPRLATGGIVNMPNKGTMIGGAIAGESGREGVVPLTDNQAMAELGREIGKNVLVNLTNITTMNGRVIGRELKQVQSEQDFAFNT